jgi:hypothetical protein
MSESPYEFGQFWMASIDQRIIHSCAVAANSLPHIARHKRFNVALKCASLISNPRMRAIDSRTAPPILLA